MYNNKQGMAETPEKGGDSMIGDILVALARCVAEIEKVIISYNDANK